MGLYIEEVKIVGVSLQRKVSDSYVVPVTESNTLEVNGYKYFIGEALDVKQKVYVVHLELKTIDGSTRTVRLTETVYNKVMAYYYSGLGQLYHTIGLDGEKETPVVKHLVELLLNSRQVVKQVKEKGGHHETNKMEFYLATEQDYKVVFETIVNMFNADRINDVLKIAQEEASDKELEAKKIIEGIQVNKGLITKRTF